MSRNTDPFIVVKQKPKSTTFTSITVRSDTYKIIKMMQEDTGYSIADLMDAVVKFCADRLIVRDI